MRVIIIEKISAMLCCCQRAMVHYHCVMEILYIMKIGIGVLVADKNLASIYIVYGVRLHTSYALYFIVAYKV